MLGQEEEKEEEREGTPAAWLAEVKAAIPRVPEESRAPLRRYWRRDIWLSLFLVFPSTFAFDQGVRQALLEGWFPVNLFTVFVVRPALAYLAVRSLLRWMRVDWRGFALLFTSMFALDARTFRVDPIHAAMAATLTGFVIFIIEVLLESLPQPKKRTPRR